jgi:hypothetical protein
MDAKIHACSKIGKKAGVVARQIKTRDWDWELGGLFGDSGEHWQSQGIGSWASARRQGIGFLRAADLFFPYLTPLAVRVFIGQPHNVAAARVKRILRYSQTVSHSIPIH